jgi:hypothetical protein
MASGLSWKLTTLLPRVAVVVMWVQEVGVHLPHRRRHGRYRLLADLAHRLVGIDLLAQQHIGPRAEQALVTDGDAEQLGDHDHRQGVGQRVDQVESLTDLVEELGGQLGDARLEACHDFRRERLADQGPQLAVLWGVHPDEVAALEQRKIVLLGLQRGQVGGEHGRVGQDRAGLGMAQHLPTLRLVVEVDLPVGAAVLEPGEEVVKRRSGGRHARSLPRAGRPALPSPVCP